LRHKPIERCQQWLKLCRLTLQLRQRRAGGLQRGELTRLVRLANDIVGSGRIIQGKTWQALQPWTQIQHLATFAPGAVQHHQAQISRVFQECRIKRGNQVLRGRSPWVQQHGGFERLRCSTHNGLVKRFADQQMAVQQAQIQQTRAVF